MVLIFDYYDTVIHNKSMDFNRGLIGLWEKYYKDKCSFEEIKAFGEEMYLHILELHKQGKEWAFVKDELPEYAKKFGGETIPMTSEEEADFLMTCHEVETMPNIPEALMEFENMGIPMYILSNSGFTAEALSIVLERFGIRRFFQKIWSSADFGRIKPDKDLFEMVVENGLNDNPGEGREDIVFVGDTYCADVIGAHGVGLDVIWINHNGEQNQDKLPIHIISHTGELIPVVQELKGKTYASLLETTLNTRDLGGYVTSSADVKTKYHKVYRSDVQIAPSQRDIDYLKENNITTMIDMRGKQDVEEKPSGFAGREGFTYLHFPIEEGSCVPESVAAVPGSYMDIAHAKNIAEVFKAIANAKEGVMFNCSAGKDRTGVVSALLLSLCGVSREDIVSDYMITKECNKQRFQLIRENLPGSDINIVIPRESYMNDLLNWLYDRYGSIEKYFDAIGIDSSVRDAIKRKLTE